VAELLQAEKAILALIQDVATVRAALAELDPFDDMEDDSAREAAITEALTDVLDFHRRASMRWDFIGGSNSTGADLAGQYRGLAAPGDYAGSRQGRTGPA